MLCLSIKTTTTYPVFEKKGDYMSRTCKTKCTRIIDIIETVTIDNAMPNYRIEVNS